MVDVEVDQSLDGLPDNCPRCAAPNGNLRGPRGPFDTVIACFTAQQIETAEIFFLARRSLRTLTEYLILNHLLSPKCQAAWKS
jgi:hypothetical protein